MFFGEELANCGFWKICDTHIPLIWCLTLGEKAPLTCEGNLRLFNHSVRYVYALSNNLPLVGDCSMERAAFSEQLVPRSVCHYQSAHFACVDVSSLREHVQECLEETPLTHAVADTVLEYVMPWFEIVPRCNHRFGWSCERTRRWFLSPENAAVCKISTRMFETKKKLELQELLMRVGAETIAPLLPPVLKRFGRGFQKTSVKTHGPCGLQTTSR